MNVSIAHLGPAGTYSERAAIAYGRYLVPQGSPPPLKAYPSIRRVLEAAAQDAHQLAVVPVENSTEGSVPSTLDALWELANLNIQHAITLPIEHALLSMGASLSNLQTVYSHPQALSQCQKWLATHLPAVTLIPTRSTTEALQHLDDNPATAAISSRWAANLYGLPILAHPINDHADNCTRFLILSQRISTVGTLTSLAFSLPVNAPGALLKPLEILARAGINMSRIESRPTKRSLGDYLFFIDIEACLSAPQTAAAIEALRACTETLKLFGSYDLITVEEDSQP